MDKSEHRVRLMEVAQGGLLGIGETKVPIPIDASARIVEDCVHIGRARTHVAESPCNDPEVIDEWDYYSELYGHYCVSRY